MKIVAAGVSLGNPKRLISCDFDSMSDTISLSAGDDSAVHWYNPADHSIEFPWDWVDCGLYLLNKLVSMTLGTPPIILPVPGAQIEVWLVDAAGADVIKLHTFGYDYSTGEAVPADTRGNGLLLRGNTAAFPTPYTAVIPSNFRFFLTLPIDA